MHIFPILKLSVQAKLFFLYQLPPRKFWALLLDDGFNVIDFIVVSISSALSAHVKIYV